MPWWLWLFIVYWLITGSLNAWYWWDLGDGVLMFVLRFASGFAVIPGVMIFKLILNTRDKKRTRQNEKDLRVAHPS